MNTYKEIIADYKEFIKKGSKLQTEYKRHRKTYNFKGERMEVTLLRDKSMKTLLTSDIATYRVVQQKEDLRLLNLVYGVLRGKTVKQIESKVREGNEISQETVDEHVKNLLKKNGINPEGESSMT